MRALVVLFVLAFLAGTGSAEPYWIAWEGDQLPEVQGPWERNWGDWEGQYHGVGAYRTIEDGILTYDSLYDPGVYDYSFMYRPGALDPAPGEVFVMEWRLQVRQVDGRYDPDVAVRSDDGWGLGLSYGPGYIWSIFEDVTIPLGTGAFHDYRVVSPDMRRYDLYVDGAPVRSGDFVQVAVQSYVAWGDGWQGWASLHSWDYVRFGVVPEPGSIWLLGLVACCVRRRGERPVV